MDLTPWPDPVAAADAIVFDEVTYGYVPWSISSKAPWAPSYKIRFLSFLARIRNSWVLEINGLIISETSIKSS